jgi:hypothetical protein
VVTFERLAEGLGDADRRNVHNDWREFEACGGDLEGSAHETENIVR